MNLEAVPGVEVPPFLKWAGGKRWFVEGFSHLMPKDYRLYFEPFLGSGAVFFSLRPRHGVLSDKNEDLINAYNVIKRRPEEVVRALEVHQQKHSLDHYYEMRATSFSDEVQQAARFIYLNRTCWNGLYRVNKSGQFNVPIGTKSSVILGTDNFPVVSRILKSMEIISADFEDVIDQASEDDFVFVDPPYTVKHNYNGFIKYNENIFKWEDQERLKFSVDRAVNRGAKVLVLNANHESIKDLYEGYEQVALSRASVLAASSAHRGVYEELCIKCW